MNGTTAHSTPSPRLVAGTNNGSCTRGDSIKLFAVRNPHPWVHFAARSVLGLSFLLSGAVQAQSYSGWDVLFDCGGGGQLVATSDGELIGSGWPGCLVRLTTEGDVVWEMSSSTALILAPGPDGGVVTVTFTDEVAGLDGTGQNLWSTDLPTPEGATFPPRIGVVARDPEGGLALGGDHWGGGRYDGMTAYVGRLSETSDLLWGISYPYGMWAADIAIAPDGRIAVLAGSSEVMHGDLVGGRWLTLTLYSSLGEEVWSLWNSGWPDVREYVGYRASMALVGETLYVVFRSINNSSQNEAQIELWSIHLDGTVKWNRQYFNIFEPDSNYLELTLAVAPSGDLLVGGWHNDGLAGSEGDSFMLRFSPEGDLLENTDLSQPNVDDRIVDLVVMSDGRLFTIGELDGQMWVAYHPTIPTAIDPTPKPESSRLGIYPNPTSGVVSIRPPTGFLDPLEVRIFDVLGRMVYQGVLDESELDLSGLGPATYLVSIQSGDRTARASVVVR